MKKEEIINKNLERLAKLGLMVIGDSHTINRNRHAIEGIVKNAIKNKKELPLESLKIILENLEGIDWALDDMKRIQYQKEMKPKEISLAEACEKIKKFFGSSFSIEVVIKKDCKVYMPSSALFQTLINIVDNALYMPEKDKKYKWKGERENHTSNKCTITVNGNQVTISDDGKGVDETVKDKIFDFCFSTKDVEHESNTHGNGLFVAKQHSEAFNFDIAVENNTILKGANFTLTFNNFQEI